MSHVDRYRVATRKPLSNNLNSYARYSPYTLLSDCALPMHPSSHACSLAIPVRSINVLQARALAFVQHGCLHHSRGGIALLSTVNLETLLPTAGFSSFPVSEHSQKACHLSNC